MTSPPLLRRIVRWTAIALAGLLLLPYAVAPLYRFVPPVSTPILWRWLTGQRVVRSNLALAAMPAVLPRTVLAAEDGRFCSHPGIDWQEINEALADAEDGGELRGGSTITQQTAKNLFLWGGRSWLRKALELPLSLWIDLVLPKRRILEIYLNIAEWGPDGEFGVDAGAKRAFGKSASAVNGREAALLAAMLPNPIRRSAGRPSAVVRRLAGIYQRRAAAAPVDSCLRAREG